MTPLGHASQVPGGGVIRTRGGIKQTMMVPFTVYGLVILKRYSVFVPACLIFIPPAFMPTQKSRAVRRRAAPDLEQEWGKMDNQSRLVRSAALPKPAPEQRKKQRSGFS